MILLDLRWAMDRPGCPACRSLLRREHRYLGSIIHENVNDPVVRRRLLDSFGFCARHTWLLAQIERAEYGDQSGTSILLDAFIDEWRHRRRAHLALPGEQARRRIADLQPGRECRACQSIAQGSETELREFVRALPEDSQLAGEYDRSDGLCLPHVTAVLATVPEALPGRELIIERALRSADELQTYLREYDRLRAWGFHDEPRGIEQTAAKRGAALFGGIFENLARSVRDTLWPRPTDSEQLGEQRRARDTPA